MKVLQKFLTGMALVSILLAACTYKANGPAANAKKALVVFGAYATSINEPWDSVIHAALLNAEADGRIVYRWQDTIGYQGDMERVLLREIESDTPPDIIFGDSFGNEEIVRAVAAKYPNIAFVFGSGLGPAEPNLSVFDNWIHEPAYLSGLIAGKMTQTGIVGVVAGFPVAEVNRLVNAFIQGAREENPNVKVKVTFINSWFDPESARNAAKAQIAAGADMIFCERVGCHKAAMEHSGILVFGNISDQNSLAPNIIITGPVWNMEPTVDYILNQVSAGVYTAQDLKDFSSMAKGGASLAPFHGLENQLPAEVKDLIASRQAEIINGLFRVEINENIPVSD